MTSLPLRILRTVVAHYPAVVPHLKGRARWVVFAIIKPRETFENSIYSDIRLFKTQLLAKGIDLKTYEFFLDALEGLIQGVYDGNVAGEFVDILANLISGQLTQAFEQAWQDEEGEGDMPDYLTGPLEEMILGQYDHVDQLFRDIVDAKVDETPIDPLLARAGLWANQWTSAYNEAVRLITLENGGNLEWVEGDTEDKCETCLALNGIVAPASVWDELGVHPQGFPNDVLDCKGGHCDCKLEPTDKRKSPKAYDLILNAVNKQKG